MTLGQSSVSLNWNVPKKGLADLTQICDQIHRSLKNAGEKIPLKASNWLDLCIHLQEIDEQIRDIEALLLCYSSANMRDPLPISFESVVNGLKAEYQVLIAHWQGYLRELSIQEIEEKLNDPLLIDYRFFIREIWEQAQSKLNLESEQIIHMLSIDGLHAWQEAYYSLNATLSVLDPDHPEKKLSLGQAENKLLSIFERPKRKSFFDACEGVWKEKEQIFATILNHLAGYKTRVCQLRNNPDFLQEPLQNNRLQKESLDAMWEAVQSTSPLLLQYLKARSKLLQIDQCSWYDVSISLFDSDINIPTYPEAIEFVQKEMESFHPRMGAFISEAAQKGWIESENRLGKRSGAFCVLFPRKKESRVFMTYTGNFFNLLTLAHELGHAYHNEVLAQLPGLQQKVPMSIAESASTLAEVVLIEALLKQKTSREQKLFLIDAKLQRAVLYLMNIRARFLFEERFYQKRRDKALSPQEFCQLMEEVQKEAFCQGLEQLHPYFWCSKLHFYFTDYPFYNFPYTFGYLLSHNLYHLAKKGPASFPEKYDAFLADSGRMDIEPLIAKHLSMDVKSPLFWKESLKDLKGDIEAFSSLI